MSTIAPPSLFDIVTSLDELAADLDERNVAFGLVCEPEGVQLAAKGFDMHPCDAFTGFVAPQEWHAFVVATSGDRVDLDAGAPSRRAVRATVGLARTGEQVSVLRDLDTGAVTCLDGPGEGLVVDTMARVLGLPTPPPEVSPLEALHHVWLHRVLRQTLAHGAEGTPLWPDLARLHPAAPMTDLLPAALGNAVADVARELGWEGMRRAGIGADHPVPDALRRWFDDGSYARWLGAALPAAGEIVDDLCELLPAATLALLVRVLRGTEEAA